MLLVLLWNMELLARLVEVESERCLLDDPFLDRESEDRVEVDDSAWGSEGGLKTCERDLVVESPRFKDSILKDEARDSESGESDIALESSDSIRSSSTSSPNSTVWSSLIAACTNSPDCVTHANVSTIIAPPSSACL